MRKHLFNNNINIITSSKSTTSSFRSGVNHNLDLGDSGVQTVGQNQTASMPPYSSISRQTVMVKNLKLGIDYKTKQYDHLSSINDYLNDIIRLSNSSRDSNTSSWIIYLQSIATISEATYFNLPLFGHGTEPPIRVHLVLKGTPRTFEFHVSELLNRPHFKSFVHSGVGVGAPSCKLLHDCLKESMDEQIKISFERSKAESILKELEVLTINKAKLLSDKPREKTGNNSLLEKLYFHISSQIFQKLRNA